MTRAQEAACLGVAAGLGLMLALSIPDAIPISPPNPSHGERSGSGSYIEPPAPLRASAGSVAVVDGDSLRLNGAAVRLWGVDAPESGQTCTNAAGHVWACGAAATASLRGMIERDPAVTCERRDTDRHGRTVAVCCNSTGDLGAMQVARGLAVAYRRFSSAYVDHEDAAKAERLGMWGGTFTPPEQFRKEHKR